MECVRKEEMLRALIDDRKRKEDSAVLSVYLNMAKAKILGRLYPYRENWDDLDVPDKYVMLQLKIAAYLMNKRGAEGQIQHIENGVHRNYGDADVPESMLSDLAPFVGIPRR